jgi:signal transduction histidine kinase
MVIEKGIATFCTQHRRKDGSIWPVEITTSFSEVHDGCFFAFIEDITERIEAEEKLANYSHHLETQVKERTSELEVARQEAEHANIAKSEFLSSMSHELRTPLNAILGFAQLIEMNTKVDNTRESSQEIINAGNHLLSLINQVLDLSKIESGNLDLSFKKCFLNEILDDMITLIKPLAEKNSIIIDNKVNTLSYINVDEIRFKQILLNILSNAIKYNRENGKVIINSSVNDRNIICLSISDTGTGLTDEQLNNIFEPFERLGKENSNIEGTGLGLKISKELIELMGGTITVESTVGKGSIFFIQFPLS